LKKNAGDLIEGLRSSKKKAGMILTIIEDYYGNIIDRMYREKADGNWPRLWLENVKTEKDKVIVRLILNICRRSVSAQEKTEMLDKLGEILMEESIREGRISKRIAEETRMSYQWVMKYLSDKYNKDDSQAERGSSALRHRARIKKLLKLLKPPRKKLLEINKYAKSDRLQITVEKTLYEKVIEATEILKMTPDTVLQNMMKKELKEVAALKSEDIEALARAVEVS